MSEENDAMILEEKTENIKQSNLTLNGNNSFL